MDAMAIISENGGCIYMRSTSKSNPLCITFVTYCCMPISTFYIKFHAYDNKNTAISKSEPSLKVRHR